jgi:amidohydrolase
LENLIDQIKQLAESHFEEIRDIRRHIHAHPELSFEERQTAEYIEEKLNQKGIPARRIAGTGILAEIKGEKESGKTIALRSDHDALPISEKNTTEYVSLNKGVMHACGHDVHTSSLLGASFIMQELKKDFGGTIRLLFQPGEEKLPGGATRIIAEGGLQYPVPNAIIGQHVTNEIPVGKVGFRPGLYMASTDEIYITVKGKGGHGAMPHLNIDPVLISAHLIIAMQQIVSRVANPAIPSVLSFGRVIADGVTNVIPDEVKIEGTFRTFNEKWRKEAHSRIESLAKSLAESMGGEVEIRIENGYPFLKNDENFTKRLMGAAMDYVGQENVVELDIRMTAEDFAFYTHYLPACFYRLGTGNPAKGITAPVHTPHFDIDEEALKTGSGLMSWLALDTLNRS